MRGSIPGLKPQAFVVVPKAPPQHVVGDLLEAPPALPGELLEPGGEVVVEGQRRPHGDIMMLALMIVKMSRALAGVEHRGRDAARMPEGCLCAQWHRQMRYLGSSDSAARHIGSSLRSALRLRRSGLDRVV